MNLRNATTVPQSPFKFKPPLSSPPLS